MAYMNKHKEIAPSLIRISIALYVVSIVLGPTISFVLSGIFVIIIKTISLIILLLAFYARNISPSKKERLQKRNPFPILMMVIFMPFLWNNALIADGMWMKVANYVLVFIYTITLSLVRLEPKEKRFFLTLFIAFGVITSLFSWLSVISADKYYYVVKNLFPLKIVEKMMHNLTNGNLYGLTDHYTRNAFYVVVSIIFTFLAYKDKKKYILLLFFLATLLAIGKRGHLLFLIISAIISFFIIKRVSFSTIIKFLTASLVIIGCLFLLSMKVPQVRHTIERAEESADSGDITTGRDDLYLDAKELYEENHCIPIGWGRYASSTNYRLPGLHNDYFQLYYEVGIIGELLVVIPNIIFLIYSVKEVRNGSCFARIVLVYNIFFLTYSFTGLPRYDYETQFVYYALNSIMISQLSIREVQKNEK